MNDARKTNCLDHEYCNNGVCKCLPGYHGVDGKCVRKDSKDNSVEIDTVDVDKYVSKDNQSHLAIVIVVPILLIIALIGSVVVVKKYNIVNWIRNKIHQRDTPYDEVMIGQDDDDPPLSGV